VEAHFEILSMLYTVVYVVVLCRTCAVLYLQEFSGCSCDWPASLYGKSVPCVSDCSVYGAYWFILFLATVARSMTQVGVVMLFLRSANSRLATIT